MNYKQYLKLASNLDKTGQYKRSDYIFNLVLAQTQDDENPEANPEANDFVSRYVQNPSQFESPQDDEEDDDEDYTPHEIIHPTPVFFNADTNQPVMHEGKYLAALPYDQDLPEIRGKVKAMTGLENLTIVRIPVNILVVQWVRSESDIRKTQELEDALASGIEDIGDFGFLLMINENILDSEGKDLVFASESDAYGFGRVIAEHYKRSGREMEISVAPVAVSLMDAKEEGMSLPEMYADDEFIFVSNSSFKATEIPETMADLRTELFHLARMRTYTVDRLQKEKLGEYDFDVDYEED